MDRFSIYLELGFRHISDLAGYDHILFLVALCAVYRLEQWRQIVVLVTAFTVGHSVTLALAGTGALVVPSNVVEFLIPVTILLTAIHNVVTTTSADGPTRMGRRYLLALFFGFIHGMGFSNYFRALIMDASSIMLPLFGFNLGIEIGQLLVVCIIVGIAFICLNIFGVRHRDWNLFVSGAAAGLSLNLMFETRFW